MNKKKLHKYEALGNDMIVFDPAAFDFALDPDSIRLLCDRHRGIGADGICYGPLPGSSNVFEMRFFNPDGTEAEKSGNGLRIFARYLIDSGYVSAEQDTFVIGINNELIKAKKLDETGHQIALEMGRLSFQSEAVGLSGEKREVVGESFVTGEHPLTITAVSVGNPHCVVFNDDLQLIHTIGPLLENDPRFLQRTNVQVVRVLGVDMIHIAIWERGAGYTLASGTSACATAGAAIRNGLCKSPVTVMMDGGAAEVKFDNEGRVTLTGKVNALFSCELEADLMKRLRDE